MVSKSDLAMGLLVAALLLGGLGGIITGIDVGMADDADYEEGEEMSEDFKQWKERKKLYFDDVYYPVDKALDNLSIGGVDRKDTFTDEDKAMERDNLEYFNLTEKFLKNGNPLTEKLVDELYLGFLSLHTKTSNNNNIAQDRVLSTLSGLAGSVDINSVYNAGLSLYGLYQFIAAQFDVVTAISLVKHLENRASYDPRFRESFPSFIKDNDWFLPQKKYKLVERKKPGRVVLIPNRFLKKHLNGHNNYNNNNKDVLPPVENHQKHNSNYKPPRRPRPSNIYTPPNDTYDPPEESYSPPEETYKTTQGTYKPTQGTYKPTKGSYKPTQGSYTPTQSGNSLGYGDSFFNSNYDDGGSAEYGGGSTNYGGGAADYGGGSTNYGGGSTNYGGGSNNYGGGSTNYGGGSNNYDGGSSDYGGGSTTYSGGSTSYGGGSADYGGGSTDYDGGFTNYGDGSTDTFFNEPTFPKFPNLQQFGEEFDFDIKKYSNKNEDYSHNQVENQRPISLQDVLAEIPPSQLEDAYNDYNDGTYASFEDDQSGFSFKDTKNNVGKNPNQGGKTPNYPYQVPQLKPNQGRIPGGGPANRKPGAILYRGPLVKDLVKKLQANRIPQGPLALRLGGPKGFMRNHIRGPQGSPVLQLRGPQGPSSLQLRVPQNPASLQLRGPKVPFRQQLGSIQRPQLGSLQGPLAQQGLLNRQKHHFRFTRKIPVLRILNQNGQPVLPQRSRF